MELLSEPEEFQPRNSFNLRGNSIHSTRKMACAVHIYSLGHLLCVSKLGTNCGQRGERRFGDIIGEAS